LEKWRTSRRARSHVHRERPARVSQFAQRRNGERSSAPQGFLHQPVAPALEAAIAEA